MPPSNHSDEESTLVGLWVLLVANEGQLPSIPPEARVPMMARAGDARTYLLGFKNMTNARKFVTTSELEGVEPRLVVKGNMNQLLSIARDAGAVGVLVDWDPSTKAYASATELY